ncbi:hypothetical protein ACLOJK_030811 [Asimina triloba]
MDLRMGWSQDLVAAAEDSDNSFGRIDDTPFDTVDTVGRIVAAMLLDIKKGSITWLGVERESVEADGKLELADEIPYPTLRCLLAWSSSYKLSSKSLSKPPA